MIKHTIRYVNVSAYLLQCLIRAIQLRTRVMQQSHRRGSRDRLRPFGVFFRCMCVHVFLFVQFATTMFHHFQVRPSDHLIKYAVCGPFRCRKHARTISNKRTARISRALFATKHSECVENITSFGSVPKFLSGRGQHRARAVRSIDDDAIDGDDGA